MMMGENFFRKQTAVNFIMPVNHGLLRELFRLIDNIEEEIHNIGQVLVSYFFQVVFLLISLTFFRRFFICWSRLWWQGKEDPWPRKTGAEAFKTQLKL